MTLVSTFDLYIEKMDLKKEFLHEYLEEEIYMKNLEGLTMKGKEELVYGNKKSIYGLKQSLRMWYQKIDSYIKDLGFKKIQVGHCVYSKQVREHFIYVALYVDDMFLVGNDMDLIKEVKQQLSSKFNMKDLRLAHFII